MILAALLLLLPVQEASGSPPQAVEGRGAPAVAIPRVEQEITVDGVLDEGPWQGAARLTGFHQYQPVDGRPAEERTEVLVWYSPRAIHFGIIAHARVPSSVRATLADRDNIDNDDRITIYLDTFNDRRRAFFFAVNPLGVQQDGVRSEGAASAGNIFGGNVDLNPDYYYESKGQVTDSGYQVEVRIPFKSLRFPSGGPQRWGLNVVRNIPATGYEDTWTDVRRASASFLLQAGTIEGLAGMERGLVTEVQPFVTANLDGARDLSTAEFDRGDVRSSLGANVRLGLQQISFDATVNPDFSQVESDVGLVTVNERFALFLPEKRPFFLEGIELFSTSNQLVYTRRIVDPVVGGKITGKFGRFGVAHLTALDDAPGDDALFNVSRVRADFGGNSLAGLTLTDRRHGDAFNTVVAGDTRVVFGRLYYVEGQLGASRTRDDGGVTVDAALWKLEFDRTGRSWGFNYQLNALDEGFESQAGFVPRTGIVAGHAFNRLSFYGERGALVENFTMFFGPNRIWRYGDLGERAIEGDEHVNLELQLRGGWEVEAELGRRFFTFDDALFDGFETSDGQGGFAPYLPPDDLSDLFFAALSFDTPIYQTANAGVEASFGEVPIFTEAAPGRETRYEASLNLRPRPTVRVEASAVYSRITRERDGSEFARTIIPRLKVEYQASRALFFRVVAEHLGERQSALLDARTGAPLRLDGIFLPSVRTSSLRVDWLVSYEPTPGTVAFFGYGSTLEDPNGTGLSNIRRSVDGFFVKLAYQFRR
jgi:hypothetical protein